LLAALALAAAGDGSPAASFALGALGVLLALWIARDCAAAAAGMRRALDQAGDDQR